MLANSATSTSSTEASATAAAAPAPAVLVGAYVGWSSAVSGAVCSGKGKIGAVAKKSEDAKTVLVGVCFSFLSLNTPSPPP